MINMRTEGSKTILEMVVDGVIIQFQREDYTPFHAKLVKRRADEIIMAKLQDIREESYDHGFKQAKAKVKKQTAFYCWW